MSAVIDDTVGQCFDLLVEDVDMDGRLDFMLTAFLPSIRSGKVYIFEIPDDLLYVCLAAHEKKHQANALLSDFHSNGAWVRHIIAEDFVPTPGSNRMSPGSPNTYYPSREYADELLEDGRSVKSLHFIM